MWTERYRSWQGNAAELADAAAEALREVALPAEPRPNERLVRDYVQRTIVDRPMREGKEARYAFRHLAQFLAARALLNDSWPLAKIAEMTSTAANEELVGVVPETRSPTAAEQALAQLRGAGPQQKAPRTRVTPLDLTRARQDLRAAAQALDPSGPSLPERSLIVRLRLAPWCEVQLNAAALESITRDTAEQLGRALTAALLVERSSGGKKP